MRARLGHAKRRITSTSNDGRAGGTVTGKMVFAVRLHGGVLVSGGQDGLVKVWSLSGAVELVATLNHGAPVRGLALSVEGRFVASAGGSAKRMVVWRAALGKQ